MRRSMAARMGALENRGAELAGLPGAGPVSQLPVHVATVEVMAELLTLGNQLAGPDTPAVLRAMMRTLDHARPMLTEQIAEIPPEQIREFLAHLAGKLQRIIDSDDDAPGEQDGPGRPLADLA